MLPGGGLAALFLLSLVPGFVFLRISERARKPRAQSQLLELLEVVAVGAATTGVAGVCWITIIPGGFYRLFVSGPASGADLREAAWLLLWVLIQAIALAVLLAFALDSFTQDRFAPSVWHGTLARSRVPAGHIPHVLIELVDGTQVEGTLAHYTMADDVAHRDVALLGPVITVTFEGNHHRRRYDSMIVPGEQVRTIALRYVPASRTSSK